MRSSEQLLAGEKLLWKGAPERGMKFGPRDLLTTFFGLFFFGFSLFWEFMAYNMGAPTFFMLFGIPFVLVGAYLVIGRFFWEAYARGRTTYVLTDLRALIKVDVFGRSQKAVTLRELEEVAIEENRDGTGTIVFGRDVTKGSGDNSTTSYAPRFTFVRDVKKVYQLVEVARLKRAED